MNQIHAIILAAGKGLRMNSNTPKVLQVLSDKPLLAHVLSQAKLLSDKIHVVYGFGGTQIKNAIPEKGVNWVEQVKQLGTGHAVQQVMPAVEDDSISLILYADVPLIEKSTLEALLRQVQQTGIALVSVVLNDPTGYGRIIREHGEIQAIVEQKDGNQQQLTINEVSTGIMAVNSQLLKQYLAKLNPNNTQDELYLTDIIASAVADGKRVAVVVAKDEFEVSGVNDKTQLAALERVFQRRQADKFMQQGLTLKDPNRFDCRGTIEFGKDCEVDVNVVFIGDVVLGDNVHILPHSIVENACIESGARIGPFAHIRPQTHIGKNAKIGNFVEVKKSNIGADSKISHLSYVGDSVVGRGVNIGAGVITCNYDGVSKHQTLIGDGAFIGSDSQLVAPVTIGKNATIGAGSTITKDAPEGGLTLSRSKQIHLSKRQGPAKTPTKS